MSGLFSKETRSQIAIQPGELRIVVWAGLWFFLVLGGYSLLRPVREQLGISGGIDKLPWLFLGTWLTMLCLQPLYGWVVSKLPRRRFIPLVYHFFSLSLVGFFAALVFLEGEPLAWTGRAFFVWVSVLNLWVISVFWSFLADHFGSNDAKRLYAWIAVGGTFGSIVGALVTSGGLELIERFGGDADAAVPYLLLACVVCFELAVRCVHRLLGLFEDQPARGVGVGPRPIIGGSALAGLSAVVRSPYLLKICLYLLCYAVTGTLLYFMQAEIVERAFDSRAAKTQAFAVIDLVTQVLTLFVQVLLTRRLLAALGLGRTLGILPILAGLAFAALAAWPVFAVLVVTQALRRAGRYAVTKPSREVLFSVVSREEKYKAKATIDTFVYRTGDVVGGGLKVLLGALSVGFVAVAAVAIPVTAGWALLSLRLGREHAVRAEADPPRGDE